MSIDGSDFIDFEPSDDSDNSLVELFEIHIEHILGEIVNNTLDFININGAPVSQNILDRKSVV